MTYTSPYDMPRHGTLNTLATQSSAPKHIRLCYFISRNNGTCVPLVPADELPYSVRLHGVPRVMAIADTCGMQHVGMLPYTGHCFSVEKEQCPVVEAPASPAHNLVRSEVPAKRWLAPDAAFRAVTPDKKENNFAPKSNPSLPTRPVSAAASASNWRKPAVEPSSTTQDMIDAIVASNANTPKRVDAAIGSPTPASGASPDQEKKVYCTHWIRHGECDYTQQGCLYKHEMPDKLTLEKIGFRTVPRWYLEKTAPRLQGMSSLPTVGTPMKASEWLEKRSSDCSDADDESETSESGEASESDILATPVSQAAHESVDEAGPTCAAPTTLSHTPETTPATPRTPRLFDSIRERSLDDNLIDFSPLLPTPSSSDCSDTITTTPQTSSSAPSKRAVYETEGGRKTKKIFVPAGELPVYHLADARRCARNTTSNVPKTVSSNVQVARDRSTQPAAASKTSGLMAPIHAPARTVSFAAAVTKQRNASVPEHSGPETDRTHTRPAAPRHHRGAANNPAVSSTAATASSSTRLSVPPGRAQAVRSSSKSSSDADRRAKDRSSGHAKVQSACRPRRPAGSAAVGSAQSAQRLGKTDVARKQTQLIRA